MIPASQPACVLVRDQVSMNCGRSAGTVENPARPRISAPHIAKTIAAEGTAGAELAEFTAYIFPSVRLTHDPLYVISAVSRRKTPRYRTLAHGIVRGWRGSGSASFSGPALALAPAR